MRHIDVMKKRPSRWPWALGVVLLGLALWGATLLLRPPAEDEGPELPVTAADTLPPAEIPLTRGGARPEPEPPSLSELIPLGEEQVGETLKVEGDVVATGNDAVWILAGTHVIRVDSREHARKGETLSLEGILQAADAEMTDRVTEQVLSREPGYQAWTVIREFKVVEKGLAEDAEDAAGDSDRGGDRDSAAPDADTTSGAPTDGD